MNARYEFFDDEQDAIMKLLLAAEALLNLKGTNPPKKDPESGKLHLYIETVDHKKRTKAARKHQEM